MTRILMLAALAAFAALPALAQASPEQIEAMKAAIEANGCRVTAANNAAILGAAGLAEDVAAQAVQALIDAGEAAIEGGELVLRTGACA